MDVMTLRVEFRDKWKVNQFGQPIVGWFVLRGELLESGPWPSEEAALEAAGLQGETPRHGAKSP